MSDVGRRQDKSRTSTCTHATAHVRMLCIAMHSGIIAAMRPDYVFAGSQLPDDPLPALSALLSTAACSPSPSPSPTLIGMPK
jgi:hypothetical protein